jgi:hypothetical protein
MRKQKTKRKEKYEIEMKRKEKYENETKRKDKFRKRKKRKNRCEIITKTCETKAKLIPFRFVSL